MNRFKAIFVWLSRITHCRGFGVQSPSAYRFIRYVVNEHAPYYQYAVLGRGDDRLTRKLGKLYFRIANEMQANTWAMVGYEQANAYQTYISGGCKRTVITDSLPNHEVDVVCLRLVGDYRQTYISILNKVNEHSLLILDGIMLNQDTRAFWDEVVEDKRAGVTFDLYYCGIVFFDHDRPKQNYIVNF